MESPQMIVGPLEGAFLKMMTQLVQATSVLEIGMFTGYSALCFAEALPVDGAVLTCEIDEESAALARQYFARSPVGKKIDVRILILIDNALWDGDVLKQPALDEETAAAIQELIEQYRAIRRASSYCRSRTSMLSWYPWAHITEFCLSNSGAPDRVTAA
jgi:caffeoyl-CoA O-methyltransferase